jgi:hypothetical protein
VTILKEESLKYAQILEKSWQLTFSKCEFFFEFFSKSSLDHVAQESSF